MFNNANDNIGFNPTQNQSEFGTPRVSGYGMQLRATPKWGMQFYFPTKPFKGILTNAGAQVFNTPPVESLYGDTWGYRGIVPVTMMPLINKPYPYQK